MVEPAFLGGNVLDNAIIPGGIRVFFKRENTTVWIPLGDIADVSATPLAEFFEFFSTYDGRSARAKRILQNRSISIEVTLNEVNLDNLKFAFLANDNVTDSLNIPATSTPQRTAAGTLVLPEAAGDVGSILSVRSLDGGTTYVVTTDYVVSPNNVLTIQGSSSLDTDVPNEGDRAHVLYEVIMASADTRSMEVLQDTEIEGIVQFQVRNQDGGLAQVLVLDSGGIAPAGAVPFPTDGVQSLPLTITGNILNNSFGKLYVKNIA